MRYLTVVLLALLALASAHSARAEEPDDIAAGARVRVSTDDVDERIGLVEKVTSNALVIRLDGDALPWTVPFIDLTSVEMSHGQRGRCSGAWNKAKWGTLIGAVSGLSLGFQHEQVGEDGASVPEAMALGAWSGGLFGGLIGAAIGAMDPGEKWEKVTPAFQVLPKEYGGGFSFAATIEF